MKPRNDFLNFSILWTMICCTVWDCNQVICNLPQLSNGSNSISGYHSPQPKCILFFWYKVPARSFLLVLVLSSLLNTFMPSCLKARNCTRCCDYFQIFKLCSCLTKKISPNTIISYSTAILFPNVYLYSFSFFRL